MSLFPVAALWVSNANTKVSAGDLGDVVKSVGERGELGEQAGQPGNQAKKKLKLNRAFDLVVHSLFSVRLRRTIAATPTQRWVRVKVGL